MGELVSLAQVRAARQPAADVQSVGPVLLTWSTGYRWLKMKAAMRDAADYYRLLCVDIYGKDSPEYAEAKETADQAMYSEWMATGRLMAMGAETVAQLRWKEERRKFLGGSPEWEAAIASDRAALADKLALAARRGASKRRTHAARRQQALA